MNPKAPQIARQLAALKLPCEIRGVEHSIDTLKLWLPRRVTEAEHDFLERESREGWLRRQPEALQIAVLGRRRWSQWKRLLKKGKSKFGPLYRPIYRRVGNQRFRQRVILQSPSPAALEFLRATFGEQIHINRVHLARDLVVDTVGDAHLLNEWHDERQVRPFRGQPHFVRRRGQRATYYAPKGAERNLVRYASRPQKKTGRPCLHIEARLQKRAVRAEGLASLMALLNLNHDSFWQEWIVLFHTPDDLKLGLHTMRRTTRGRIPKGRVQLRQLATRLGRLEWLASTFPRGGYTANELEELMGQTIKEHDPNEGGVSAQVCLDRGRIGGRNRRRALRRGSGA